MMVRRLLVCVCRLYPADFRARFHDDMRTTIDLSVESIPDGRSRAVWAVREATGLAAGAIREWSAKFVGDPVARARALPDCRYMRPVGITRAEWGAGLVHVIPRGGAA
jgi:hypothetical protein